MGQGSASRISRTTSLEVDASQRPNQESDREHHPDDPGEDPSTAPAGRLQRYQDSSSASGTRSRSSWINGRMAARSDEAARPAANSPRTAAARSSAERPR